MYILLLLLATGIFAQGFNPDSLPVWKGYENLSEIQEQKDTTEKKTGNLQTRGSKSFQTSVGSGGADIQQELRLSVQGETADGIFIDAYLVDVGRPAGTEITTTLRETDAAYIGVESKKIKLELGDLNYEAKENALFGLRRQTLGAGGKLKGENLNLSAIYGTDKTERQFITFRGQPSQQKGYMLFSDSAFGLIAPHTEQVYLNGVLLAYGKDYEINYAGGVLDFLGKIIPGPEDEIRVEYDSYSSLNSSELRGLASEYRSKYIWMDVTAFNLRDSLKSDKMLGARFRSENPYLPTDLEIAMNEQDSKAYRWIFGGDKALLKGGYADSAFAKPEYSGSENVWDAYILRDKWLMDSVPQGNLRYDEFTAKARLPFGLSPGFFIGHRNLESVRGEGFLRRETKMAESEILLANVNNELWQGEIKSKFLQGDYRPYGNYRMDNKENLRSIYGLEWGNENAGKYANTEIMREQTDSSGFSNWKSFIALKEKFWHSNTLFQVRVDSAESFLLDQNIGYTNPNSALRGEVFYSFNYTNEVPWIAIYRSVPDGAGDVYLDTLTGQYISGVDNGNLVYEGMGRVDSLASKSTKNNLRWDLSMHPKIFVKEGFLSDITFFANGEWLKHSDEKMLLLDNSALWEHPRNKGSLMFAVKNKWDKEPAILYEEDFFGLESVVHYRGREKEDFRLTAKREEAQFPLSGLDWLSWFGELAWARELGSGFSVEPFYSKKYTDGFYFEESWNAALQAAGINGNWQNERGDFAGVGVSGNYVEKSSAISPYSAVDGFEDGFSWRASANAQMAFNEKFYLSAQYVMRAWRGNTIQKLSAQARAIF